MADPSTPRTVLVTGGSRGIGAAIVGTFLELGDRVATCSRSRSDATDDWSAQYPDRFTYTQADLRDTGGREALVAATVERFAAIDVLVNNAGVAHAGVLGLMVEEEIDEIVDVNLKATIGITRLVSRHMLSRRSGRIVTVSSVAGLSGYRGLSVYSATKAALDGLTRSLARELGGRGITVNSVAPGYLATEMSYGLDETQIEQIRRRTPLGRLCVLNDVAGAVRFLASEEAAFVTGQVLVVDGGLTA